ncbi:MAG TPA: DUF192 domain-containing protein [Candidatus Paceibacterota bacterium]|nr:DUF192 domain-containing protein [Candidatus Paceibacterota bacterium]
MQSTGRAESYVAFGTTTVSVEIASTSAEQEQGLSGRTSLAEGSGMLFVFPDGSQPGFWMKGMNFSLDIIFITSSGKVITIDRDLAPDTYPQAFYPSGPIRYALEVPAGFAAAHTIEEGSMAEVHII